jgi:hypothetical protein
MSGVKIILIQPSSGHIHSYFIRSSISPADRSVGRFVSKQSRNLLVSHGHNSRVNFILVFTNSTVGYSPYIPGLV